tara:strand:- start:1865 stop:2035 length:171 start_codon:yes stop_codon:yes gene_type:complete
MKLKKLRNIKTNEVKKFKPYLIGNIPPSFDKEVNLYFNQKGITYIEKTESIFDLMK